MYFRTHSYAHRESDWTGELTSQQQQQPTGERSAEAAATIL